MRLLHRLLYRAKGRVGTAGAPVSRAQRGSTSRLNGDGSGAGVMWLCEGAASELLEIARAHETVHVLQHDAAFVFWREPTERWLFDRIPGGVVVGRYVDLGIDAAALAAVAEFFTATPRPAAPGSRDRCVGNRQRSWSGASPPLGRSLPQ